MPATRSESWTGSATSPHNHPATHQNCTKPPTGPTPTGWTGGSAPTPDYSPKRSGNNNRSLSWRLRLWRLNETTTGEPDDVASVHGRIRTRPDR